MDTLGFHSSIQTALPCHTNHPTSGERGEGGGGKGEGGRGEGGRGRGGGGERHSPP